MLPYVSVVIPAYNEERFLSLCLESVRNQDYTGGYEIIVVDNASMDNPVKVALSPTSGTSIYGVLSRQ